MSRIVVLVLVGILLSVYSGNAACTACSDIGPGTPLGTVTANPISEASGLAASRRNVGVVWTHNDGSRERIYALSTNGALLATYNFSKNVDDLEDIAVGPGPLAGLSYIYVGDIGGNAGTNTARNEIKIVRVPEPRVDQGWAADPPTSDMEGVDTFTLTYPDGSYDAEALLLDPRLMDLYIVTKDADDTRLYRANVASVTNRAELALEFIRSLSFADVSGGTVSHDGLQIILRRENAAMIWGRCSTESIGDALAQSGQPIPVIGPPFEPNGEGVSFASAGSGYLTISEGAQPLIYFFQALCPSAPQFTLQLADQSGFVGGNVRFEGMAVGYPPPIFSWRANGQILPNEQDSFLILSNLTASTAGQYELIASNVHGIATSHAELTVRAKPDLRITEALSSPVDNASVDTADWWELTSFESQAVDLSRWRFNDNSGGLTDPFTLPTGISIAPGESIIFVDNLSPAEFRAWWGSNQIPASIQVISYEGGGLGLGAGGDGLRLWNSTTMVVADTVASVDFGAADPGVSFNFDPVTGQFGAKSQLGVNGVFRASASTDIGSPGRIVAPAAPPSLTAVLVDETIRIEFDAAVGHRYSLQARGDFAAEGWTPTGDSFIATNNVRAQFEKSATTDHRFFRVLVE